MGRGSYIGGHTVVGPGSGWFSKSRVTVGKTREQKEKAKAERKARRKALLAAMTPEQRAQRDARLASERVEQKQLRQLTAGKAAARKAKKLEARQEAEAAARAKAAARKAKKIAAKNSWEANRRERAEKNAERDSRRLGRVKVFRRRPYGGMKKIEEGLSVHNALGSDSSVEERRGGDAE